jgi:hypothetical protein
MAGRIKDMRRALVDALAAAGAPGNWDHITSQVGPRRLGGHWGAGRPSLSGQGCGAFDSSLLATAASSPDSKCTYCILLCRLGFALTTRLCVWTWSITNLNLPST